MRFSTPVIANKIPNKVINKIMVRNRFQSRNIDKNYEMGLIYVFRKVIYTLSSTYLFQTTGVKSL